MRLVYLALGWCAGIVLAANIGLRQPILWLALAILMALLAWRTRRIEIAAVMLLALGGLRMSLEPISSGIAAYNGLGGMTITGTVIDEPDRTDSGVQLRVNVEAVTRAGSTIPSDGLVLVEAPPLTDARYGDQVSATGELITPGVSDRFSYADYLAHSGVFSLMIDSSVIVTQQASGSDLTSLLIDMRARAADAINHALPEPEAGLLVGMLLGNTRGIAPDVSDAFAQTGASQIIAISGFNMTILAALVIGSLKRLRVRPLPATAIALALIAAYTLLVGANPSVVRAALMSGLLVIGQAIRRQTYLPASLAFAALIMALLNPTVLWDVGFQLSFFATLGLALFAEPFADTFDRALTQRVALPLQKFIDVLIAEPLAVSVAALIFALPLTMLYFGQVSPFVLLINLLVMPFQPALLILGGAATLIAIVAPVIAQVLFWLDLIPLAWTIGVVRWFAQIPVGEVYVSPSLVALVFLVLIGGAMVKAVQPRWSIQFGNLVSRRVLISATVLAALGILLLLAALILSRPDGKLHVWMLDMGESDAVLIQSPRGAHFLIDGGSSPSRLLTALGDRLPFTNRTLEALFLTEPDTTQFAALPTVLDRYDLGVVVDQGQPNLSPDFADLQARLAAHPIVNVRSGYSLDTNDGVQIEALNPAQTPGLGDSLGANALVLRVRYGDVSFLLTSNLNSTGQEALLKARVPLQASVLQLPEQGAVRSLEKDFLAAVQPQVAVVQGDAPDAGTLGELGSTPLYRTDQGGTIDLSTDGHQLWVVQEQE